MLFFILIPFVISRSLPMRSKCRKNAVERQQLRTLSDGSTLSEICDFPQESERDSKPCSFPCGPSTAPAQIVACLSHAGAIVPAPTSSIPLICGLHGARASGVRRLPRIQSDPMRFPSQHRLRRRLALLGLAGALLGWSCDGFVELEALRCGNGIIEPVADEDCDGLPAGNAYQCGRPGTAGACRIICEDTACPPGWRCGADAVCRASRGVLGLPVVTRLDGATLDVADFDGDGLSDVVSNQQGSLGIAFGRGDGAFEVVPPISVPITNAQLAVGDVDEDGHADVLMIVGASELLVLEGRQDRTLQPVIAPAAVGPGLDPLVKMRVVPPYTTDVLLGVRGIDDGPRFEVVDRVVDDRAVRDLFSAAASLHLQVGRIGHAADPGGDVLVVSSTAGRAVRLLALTCDGDCTLTLAHDVPLPDGYTTLPNACFLGDLNLDGWPDLLVQGARGGRYPILVADGGPEGFGPMTERPALAIETNRPAPEPSLARVQGLADLGGDARPEILIPLTVFTLEGPLDSPVTAPFWVPEVPLIKPQAADLDGDGRVDLIGTGARTSLDVAYGRGDGQFLRSTLDFQTTRAVSLGDLDGDQRIDLVTALEDGVGQVFFGQPAGGFSEPVSLGAFGAFSQTPPAIVTARLHDTGIDTAVIQTPEARFVFDGNPERRPVAPIQVDGDARAVAAGRFGEGLTAWLLATSSQAGGQRHFAIAPDGAGVVPIPGDGCEGLTSDTRGFGQVMDLDGDGVDELVRLQHMQGQGQIGRSALVILGFGDRVTCSRTPALGARFDVIGMRHVDVDLDGQRDVVGLLSRTDRRLDDPLALVVWRWTADGPGAPVALEVPATYEQIDALDLGEGPRLVIIAEGAARMLTLAGVEPVFTDLGRVVPGVRASRVADLDGDGIEDLVLKTATSVLTYRQATCSAQEAWDGACRRNEAW